ncbi:MAG: hypothetical protein V7774_08065 [Pseudorhizobium pelagicum]|uniref:hypothetical protein n=1 Tax=Pseudorhizobium pelagicum TaxID=1509405 RepID=UPI00345FC409
MARRSIFDDAFNELRGEFKQSRKSDFLTDIQGQLEEDEQIYEIVRKRRSVAKYLAVSFDRALNDSEFSYSDFDLALVALDAVSGGLGITKPVNQMRALRWNSDARDLKTVLIYLGRLNPQIRPYSFLILPFPKPPIGKRITGTIHMS